jgi:hypothetical protein
MSTENIYPRKLENFHILLWLIKDLCWVTDFRVFGLFMIVPTLGLAIYITSLNRADKTELTHNLAVCFWISANAVWMVGEFYYNDSTRPIAVVFFAAGLFMMLKHYIPLLFQAKANR